MRAQCEAQGPASGQEVSYILVTYGGGRLVSSESSVARACSLLCAYLLEEVHTRVEAEDEEVQAAGRTYRTPRRLFVPSAALVEGRAHVSAPNDPGEGGLTTHPVPGARVSTSVRPDTGAIVSARRKWRLQSSRALSSPGQLPPPSAMEAPEVLWHSRGVTGGDFGCGIPWPPGKSVYSRPQGAHRMAPLVPIPSACTNNCHHGCIATNAGGRVDGAIGARPLCAPLPHGHGTGSNGWRR